MAKTALFGDSYIKRLNRFCDNFLGVPGECRFYGVGGMRADNPHQEVLKSCIDFQPDAVFCVLVEMILVLSPVQGRLLNTL